MYQVQCLGFSHHLIHGQRDWHPPILEKLNRIRWRHDKLFSDVATHVSQGNFGNGR